MVRQMTRRIFWQVVMSDMGHLNCLVLQNQQTRALPEWHQGSGSRSSNGLLLGHYLVNNLEPCREGHRRTLRGRSRLQRVSW